MDVIILLLSIIMRVCVITDRLLREFLEYYHALKKIAGAVKVEVIF